MKTLGIALLIIGLLLTIFTSFNFFTNEKVVDLGKVEIMAQKPHRVNWSPIIGLAIMGAGGIVLGLSYRKK